MSSDLIQEIQRNPQSKRAWAQWYKRTYRRVYFVAYRFARGDRDAAADLAQEAFMRFVGYEAIHRVTTEEHAVAFLIQTCRNLAIDRDKRARDISLDDIPESALPIRSETISDTTLDLEQAVLALTPDERQMIEWTREGFSIADVAGRMGISYTAAGVRLHRIRKRLQEMLDAL